MRGLRTTLPTIWRRSRSPFGLIALRATTGKARWRDRRSPAARQRECQLQQRRLRQYGSPCRRRQHRSPSAAQPWSCSPPPVLRRPRAGPGPRGGGRVRVRCWRSGLRSAKGPQASAYRPPSPRSRPPRHRFSGRDRARRRRRTRSRRGSRSDRASSKARATAWDRWMSRSRPCRARPLCGPPATDRSRSRSAAGPPYPRSSRPSPPTSHPDPCHPAVGAFQIPIPRQCPKRKELWVTMIA